MDQVICKDSLLETLREKLPPVFSRRCVERITGGLLTACNLTKLDSNGLGPNSFKMGRKVGYEKESFLKWLEPRIKQVREKEI